FRAQPGAGGAARDDHGAGGRARGGLNGEVRASPYAAARSLPGLRPRERKPPMTAVSLDGLKAEIEAGWAARADLTPETRGPVRTAVDEVIHLLDAGRVRVAE